MRSNQEKLLKIDAFYGVAVNVLRKCVCLSQRRYRIRVGRG